MRKEHTITLRYTNINISLSSLVFRVPGTIYFLNENNIHFYFNLLIEPVLLFVDIVPDELL